ncbi:MAG: hypothetical protein Kow0075_15370 [Salibacteraceae bacterium]
MESIFDPEVVDQYISRINKIDRDTKPHWGKMNATEMFAHCSLSFEYNNGERQAKVNPVLRFFLKPMMRATILGSKPYRKNSPTAPYFKPAKTSDFIAERERLERNIRQFSANRNSQEGREHAWLGKLSAEEWSRIMLKHLDHHLCQFGV